MSSHWGEGILIYNPRSKIKESDLGKIRYFYNIPKSLEILAPEAHKRVDWEISGWVALYELSFEDEMQFPIPKLVQAKTVCKPLLELC